MGTFNALKKIFILAGIFFLAGASNPPSEDMSSDNIPNYRQIFGDDYDKAISFCRLHPEISLFFMDNGISPDFAWAIVFPELIRYGSVQDKLEMAALYTLYVNFGEPYANFSVGHFQMKPSFARQLETDYIRYKNLLPTISDYSFDTTDTRQARTMRIYRLENLKWQAKYLTLFIHLLQLKHPKYSSFGAAGKLVFFATAYNAGYGLTESQLNALCQKKFFHTSLLNNSVENKFNYAGIALSYFENCSN
ncbi:MAG: hypothetical protein JXB34_03160 [Bacteroidales bacterium]|nr:hypothetical protein [Bacteroidales bacterium]